MDKVLITSIGIIIAVLVAAAVFLYKPVQTPSKRASSTSTPSTATKTTTTTTTTATIITTSTAITTTPPSGVLKIVKAVFYRTLSPDGNRMNVTLSFTVKNTATQRIILLAVKVPDANRTIPFPSGIILNPGEVLTETVAVYNNAAFRQGWGPGEMHEVLFVYRIDNQPYNMTTVGVARCI